jgi:hypothetical protein
MHTLILTTEEVNVIGKCLLEGKYTDVVNVINSINAQLRAAEAKAQELPVEE